VSSNDLRQVNEPGDRKIQNHCPVSDTIKHLGVPLNGAPTDSSRGGSQVAASKISEDVDDTRQGAASTTDLGVRVP
jgi:hypothetical protein